MSGSGLATVVFTDLVGSTRQRALIGDDAADAVVAEHDRIVTDAAGANGGRVVKTLGDGALLFFPSALDAVRAGITTQDAVAAYNTGVDPDHSMAVRVGIHAGEVVHTDGDLSGLPVAVASRVCGVADGGQVVVTSVVRSLIGRRGDVTLRSIGTHSLKGVPEPEELWAVGPAIESTPTLETTTEPVAFPGFLSRGVPAALVGRDDELAALDDAHRAAATGPARLVTVVGEPGIGKTALTSTWARSVADGGATVVGGRCTPDAALPYEPFIEIARAILTARPSVLTTLGPAAGNVAVLVPGVDAPPGLPAPAQADPDTMQYLMAEAFVALLRPASGEPPTVAVVDDIHWADEASIGVLAHLARYEGDLSVLVVGTYRDTDLVRSHPLPRLLEGLRRERRVTRIPLDSLTTDEVVEMVSARFGERVDGAVARSITVETKGNPFFVAEMAAHLRDEGAIDDHGRWVSEIPIEEYGIPEGVRDVVGRRLERLGEDAIGLLEAGAVIGPTFDIDVAATVAGLDTSAADEVFDAALAAGVLVEGDTPDEAVFGHALMRQTIYDDLAARRRVRLHRASAQALEDAGAPASEVLNHWVMANVADKALRAAVLAVEEARAASAQREAMRHLELALDLWDDVDDPEDVAGVSRARLVFDLTGAWIDFAVNLEAAAERVDAELAAGVDDPTMRGLLHVRRGEFRWMVGDIPGSLEEERLALEAVPTEPPSAERALVLANRAGRLMTGGHYRTAIEVGLEAARVIEQLDLDETVRADMTIATALGTSYGALGDLAASDDWFDRLEAIGKETGWVRATLVRAMNQGEVYRVNGRYEEALELFAAGIANAMKFGAERWRPALLSNRADVLFIIGEWDEAEIALDASPPLEPLDFPELTLIGKRLLLAAERGDDAVFDATFARIADVDMIDQEPQVNAAIWAAQASRMRWKGELEEAYGFVTTALAAHADIDPWSETAPLAALAIEIVADAVESGIADDGWIEAARAWNDQLQRSDAPDPYVGVWKAKATADLARAEEADDPALWQRVVDAAADRPYVRARAQQRLADALLRVDPGSGEADQAVDDARRTAEELGAAPLMERLR